MAGVTPSFSAKKPVSVWNRPLKLESKGLFRALGRGVFHATTGQVTQMGLDVVDGLSALGLKSGDPEQLAWVLLRNALLAAMEELAREALSLNPEEEKEQRKEVEDRLDAILDKEEVNIDLSFFDSPGNLPLLAAIQSPFAEWLQSYDLDRPAAEATARRLPSYTVVALHAEWRRGATTLYEPIMAAVDTPFVRAADREWSWSLYAAKLQRQVDEPMFGEAFGLRQVYVPLRAFYLEKPKEGSLERFGPSEWHQEKRVAVQLEREIDQWIERADRRDGYRVLSGGPGSGKSSFARMYSAKLAREGLLRLLFIPLHQFNVSDSLVDCVGEFVRLADILPSNPLDSVTGEERLLLVFDGLDELAQQGKVAAEVARDFAREVLKAVEVRNNERCRLLVLFTGREPVIQASETEFRDPQRILHVLPYLVQDLNKPGLWQVRNKSEFWRGSHFFLHEDQRHEWWKRYGEAAGKQYWGLPKELARADLEEITAQPLLNYLVALSQRRGQLDLSREINLNDIYKDLLEAVHERTWEQKRPHAAIQGMQLEEFTRVLEEIALSAWHGNGRTTTVSDIEAHCKAAGLSGLLERFTEGAKSGVARVLTAFYFRQYGRTLAGDPTFEFTHKSFREYLTALRIVRALERIQDEIERRQKSFDAGWEERDALKHWAEICGPNPIDRELWQFVHNEVLRRGEEKARSWQQLLCRLISAMLRNGMPMERLSPRPDYHEEGRQARNSEETLLTVLYACAEVTGETSRIDWPDAEGRAARVTAGNWIVRLRGQRVSIDNGMALQSLALLDLSAVNLIFIDAHRANLVEANLEGADLGGANLEGAQLIGANLKKARLDGAALKGANLGGANLEQASLVRVDLDKANLAGVNLKGAHLGGASLREANLAGAVLEMANLGGANLEKAALDGANLGGANLGGANLGGASLGESKMEGALVSRRVLKRAKGKPVGKPKFLDS